MIDRRRRPRLAPLLLLALLLAAPRAARAAAAPAPLAAGARDAATLTVAPRAPADAPPRDPGAMATHTVAVTLYNLNTHELDSFAVPPDGRVARATGRRLARYLRCRRTGRRRAIAPGLLAIVADVATAFPGQVIEVVSGVRAAPFGAPRSKHFTGRALDLRVRGAKLADVRDLVWRRHHHAGVGYYPEQGFVHVDSRPGEPDMAWTSRAEGAPYRYAPPWAARARASEPAPAAVASAAAAPPPVPRW